MSRVITPLQLYLCLVIFFLIVPLVSAEKSKSNNWTIDTFLLGPGSGSIVSADATYNSVSAVLGQAAIFEVSGDSYTIEAGHLYTLEAEVSHEYYRTYVSAYSEPNGIQIPASTWQPDNDPYFIWRTEEPANLPVKETIKGYRFSLDTEPSLELDGEIVKEGYYQYPLDSIPDGRHTFYIRHLDIHNKWGPLFSFSLWVDATGPIIKPISPERHSIIGDNQVLISLSLEDSTSGIDKDVFLPARLISSRGQDKIIYLEYDEESGLFKYIPGAGELADGRIELNLTVADRAGNQSVLDDWQFILDTTAPTGRVTILDPSVKKISSSYVTLHLNAQAQEDEAPIVKVYIMQDGFAPAKEIPYQETLEWRLRPVRGRRFVSVQFEDAAGNRTLYPIQSNSVELSLDYPEAEIITHPPRIDRIDNPFMFSFKAYNYLGEEVTGALFQWKLDSGEWSDWQSEASVEFGPEQNTAQWERLGYRTYHLFRVKAALDLNNNGIIEEEADEVEPEGASYSWYTNEEGVLKREFGRRGIHFWRWG